MLTMFGELTDKLTMSEGFKVISAGVNYLREHLDKEIKMSELAAICNISEVYFRRLFKKTMGTSPSRYRMNLRLARAAEYLRYSDISVSEIAELLGFTDTSYFIKIFREKYSLTPLKYREKF